jgi:hypothetical protein
VVHYRKRLLAMHGREPTHTQGAPMIRVLSMHAGADTGGASYRTWDAFQRYGQPGIRFTAAIRSTNYIDYPPCPINWDTIRHEARIATIHHFHNTTRTRKVAHAPHRPFLLHHHGTHYRDNAAKMNAEIADSPVRAAATVSTLDLLDHGPNLTWIPSALDLTKTAHYRKPQPLKGRKLRVAHAPTDRAIKSTEAFLAACETANVEPVLIERKSWHDCQTIKGTADVFFDQCLLGYGNNAIEAWAMGIPVIAGGAPDTLTKMRHEFGALPFFETTEDTIADALIAMRDETTRHTWATHGTTHANRWHDGLETVTRLTKIYRELATP